jgi:sugar phosphate isomerase/epimerase
MPSLLELPDAEGNARVCRELGLQFVELNMNCPQYLPDALPGDEIRALADRSGVAFTLHLPEETDLAAFSPEARQGHSACVARAIGWAAAAGIGKLTMHLNRGVYFSLPDRKVWLYQTHQDLFLRNLIRSMDPLADLCCQKGVRLLIENTGHGDMPFLREAVHGLMARFRGPLGLTWDVGHDAAAGLADRPLIQQYLDCVSHLHLHDFDGRSAHQPLFSGLADILTPLDMATRRGWDIVIEVKTRAALEASVRALKERGRL